MCVCVSVITHLGGTRAKQSIFYSLYCVFVCMPHAFIRTHYTHTNTHTCMHASLSMDDDVFICVKDVWDTRICTRSHKQRRLLCGVSQVRTNNLVFMICCLREHTQKYSIVVADCWFGSVRDDATMMSNVYGNGTVSQKAQTHSRRRQRNVYDSNNNDEHTDSAAAALTIDMGQGGWEW